MTSLLDDAGRLAGWRGVMVGLVLRSLLAIFSYALAGLAVFAFATLLTELLLVDGGWIRVLYVPYVLLGGVVGASLGLASALRREARVLTEGSTGVLAHLADRAVGELAIPEDGVSVERLRALAELRDVVPAGGFLTRAFAGFAVRRALEQAGFGAIRTQILRAAGEAEARDETVVSRAAVREAARNGLGVAFAEQLDLGWRANQTFSRVASLLMLLSLPALAILFG
jgi:hypothetical protein